SCNMIYYSPLLTGQLPVRNLSPLLLTLGINVAKLLLKLHDTPESSALLLGRSVKPPLIWI
ncbi:MAG: hypothetical protein OIF58_12805, partial [Cohaesibacter sp.]|nr:hypothetical protein [Cohaesibacter sp.]